MTGVSFTFIFPINSKYQYSKKYDIPILKYKYVNIFCQLNTFIIIMLLMIMLQTFFASTLVYLIAEI